MGWVPIGPNHSANVSVLKVNLNIWVFFFAFENEIDADYYSDFSPQLHQSAIDQVFRSLSSFIRPEYAIRKPPK